MKDLYCFLCAQCQTQPSTGTICRAVCRFPRHIEYHYWLAKIPKSEYLFLQVYVEHCLAHRGSSVQVKPVSSGGVMEYNIGRSTQRIKNALGCEYVQLDNQQDRRAGIRSSVSPDWGIYQIFCCRTEHWSHLFARNLRERFQKKKTKNKSASQFACLLYPVVLRWANGKAIC